MNFILKGHDYKYDVMTIIQTFYPYESYKAVLEYEDKGLFIESELKNGFVTTRLFNSGEEVGINTLEVENNLEKTYVKKSLYLLLSKYLNRTIKWGILTGIRPAKFVRTMMKNGLSNKEINYYLRNNYLTDKEKIDLSIKVAMKEERILSQSDINGKNLYIGIPFCPTRCLYCSFTSYPIKKYEDAIDNYINALLKEINYAKNYISSNKLETIYIGGGTPTSINANHLERILYHLNDKLDLSNLKEFCVEAGRPDTITKEKLEILYKYNVSRLSINPQTMNDKTLKLVGRNHSVEQFLKCYQEALDRGFDNINIDLILGLPDEDSSDIIHTMEEIEKLSPTNVTIHTLSIKRASKLKEQMGVYNLKSAENIESFLKISSKYMDKLGLEPYYMYRQKNTVGNFENVGYSKNGYEGIYNIQIMEEIQDIIALGAGSASKYVNLKLNKIERAFNVKEPLEYIARIDEMIERKKRLEEIIC